jgi:ribosomal protein S18 acetylase RimI-like enzyme
LFGIVWQKALERMAALSLGSVEVAARDDDSALLDALATAGFIPTGDAGTTTWMESGDRPDVSPLPTGFQLLARAGTAHRPHHMIGRNGEHVARRLAECSLYEPDLDLMIEAPNGDVAAYSLFWPDPVTGVGLVEPMRTEADYRRLGLARHLLTTGLERLASHGCRRIKVSYENDNPAARHLYVGAGFRAESVGHVYRRQPC